MLSTLNACVTASLSIDTPRRVVAHLYKLYTMLPYTVNHNKLPAFFSSLYTNSVPKKVTCRFIASIGFKSSKERDLYGFLHAFGFVDQDGAPTPRYVEFKQSASPEVFVSSCAKDVYSDLLAASVDAADLLELSALIQNMYPDATGAQVSLMCSTFYALNTYTSFMPAVMEKNSTGKATKRPINININLPETDNEAVYGVIFKYLKDILGG